MLEVVFEFLEPGDARGGEPVVGGDADDGELVGAPVLPGLIVGADPDAFLFEKGIGVGVDVESRNGGGEENGAADDDQEQEPPAAFEDGSEKCDGTETATDRVGWGRGID